MRSISDFISFPGRVWANLAYVKRNRLPIDFIGFIIPDEGGHIFSKTDVFSKNTFITDKSPSYLMNTCPMIIVLLQIDVS